MRITVGIGKFWHIGIAGENHENTVAQLGHADIQTTFNMYAQVTPEAREESVSRMEDVLNPEPNRDEKEA